MRSLRVLLALAVFCGLPSVANASLGGGGNFQMVVVDPTPSYVVPITSDVFTVTFSPCQTGQLPPGAPSTYIGCFSGQNDTGSPLTSLQLLVPPIPGESVSCSSFGGGLDIFTVVTCGEYTSGPLTGDFFLNFSGGSIPAGDPRGCRDDDGEEGDNNGPDGDHDADDCPGGIFTIAEAGITPSSFPQVTGTFNAPEPAPALLLSTGLLMGGLFYAGRRRRALAAVRP